MSEAPQTQRKMAWHRSFGNKARTISLLLTYLTVPSHDQSTGPALGSWGTTFFKLSKKAEALVHHFHTHFLWKTVIFNMFYRTSSERLPVKMLFRTSSYHHLPLHWQTHWNHSLIPAKNLKTGWCWNITWKMSPQNTLPAAVLYNFLNSVNNKSHGNNTNILLPCEELCKNAEIHK